MHSEKKKKQININHTQEGIISHKFAGQTEGEERNGKYIIIILICMLY
jgi:hypothetical protein